jgi:uncharacterized protein (TIGR03067 family)
MRFRLRTLLLVLAVLALMASCIRPAAMAEEKGLNARWKVVIAMQGGKPIRDAVGEFAVFIDDRFVEEDQRGRVTAKGKVSIDWSKTPATIDVRFDDGFVNLGVIELRGNSMEICWGYEKRPQSLDSSHDKNFFHVSFSRQRNE